MNNKATKILIYPMLNTHSITIGMYIKSGQFYNETKLGIAHLLEHLHFRQLNSLSQKELYYKMEKMGSTLKAVTYRDFIKFSMKIAPCFLEECLDLFSKIIYANNWTENNFQKEKQVVINQIDEKERYSWFENNVRKTVFTDHPMSHGIMGLKEQVKAITIEDVQEYKKQIFNRSNILICVTGHISEQNRQSILEWANNLSIPNGLAERAVLPPKDFGNRKTKIDLISDSNDGIIDVNISFDLLYHKEEKEMITILNCILGEGVGSRLQMKVREDKGYTSDISSYLEWYADFAVLHICFSVKRDLLKTCLSEVVLEISSLKTKITEKDLEVSLPFYTTNCMFYEDDTEEMNFLLAYSEIIFGEIYKPLSIKNNKKTADKLSVLAGNIFSHNNMCVVMVGDTKDLTTNDIVKIMSKL